jgi:hypothetical protein
MAAEPAEATLSVPSAIVPELRRALLEDLDGVGVAVQDMIDERDRDLREARYRELVVRFITRHQLQQTAGWPGDPTPAELMIRGEHARTLAIDCLTRRRDRRLEVENLERLEDQPRPARRGSVAWPEPQLPDALRALADFLAGNE